MFPLYIAIIISQNDVELLKLHITYDDELIVSVIHEEEKIR